MTYCVYSPFGVTPEDGETYYGCATIKTAGQSIIYQNLTGLTPGQLGDFQIYVYIESGSIKTFIQFFNSTNDLIGEADDITSFQQTTITNSWERVWVRENAFPTGTTSVGVGVIYDGTANSVFFIDKAALGGNAFVNEFDKIFVPIFIGVFIFSMIIIRRRYKARTNTE
jgi:hypothetical protein